MNYPQLISDITFWTGASTSEYTAPTRTDNLNSHLHRVWSVILDAQDEWDGDDVNQTNFAVATSSLVAGQQDYTLPTKILKIKRVEVNYDGTWRRAKPFDVNELETATDTATIANTFNNAAPYYDVEKNTIKLYPIPESATVSGLKVFYLREPVEFTEASTNEPGFDEPFHRMLSVGASLDWAIAKGLGDKISTLQPLLNDYEAKLRVHYGSKAKDRVWQLKPMIEDYS